MDSTQFDSIARFFSQRRTRREAVVAAGVGVAALGIAKTSAQDDATPAASPVAQGGE